MRILVRLTIDVRLAQLQQRKERECNAIYEDGGRARNRILTREDIAGLFGKYVDDGGAKRVVDDYDEDDGPGDSAAVTPAADIRGDGQVN